MPLILDENGLQIQSADEIRSELESGLLAIKPDLDLSDDTPDAQLLGLLTDRESSIQEAIQATYDSQYPDSASGVSLDNARSITGQERLGNEKSTVTLTLGTTGITNVLVPAGSQVSHATNGNIFQTLSDATIPASGTVDVDAEAIEYGPISASSGTLTNIVTPVAGWDSVTNSADAVPGRLAETDPEFRLSSASNLITAPGGVAAAMENYIRNNVSGVTFIGSVVNRSKFTVNGQPPHSITMVVAGGADQDIFDAILATLSAGIQAYGNVTGTALDSSGKAQSVGFNRSDDVEINLIVNLTTNSEYPVDGDDQVKSALVNYGAANLSNGTNVVNSPLNCALSNIPGIEIIEILQAKNPTTPTGKATISIDIFERAVISSGNITVNS